MGTFIPGITDFIPSTQPYKPDLNFYSQVLQTKQAQYDSGFQQMSSIYSSILNSPMIRDANNTRRDEFLKNIDQNIKKVAGTDLSKQENVDMANRIFKPFYQDKYIIHDIAFTKKYQNELGKAEMYRNCIDPDKCGGAYWDKGVQAMQYQAEEYKNAGADDALGYTAPRYSPFINVTKKAIEAAKLAGFNIELDHKEKGYIVTDKNGTLLLGDGKSGPLPQFLYGMFGQDQGVLDMFKADAYVQRKSFAKQNAQQFGSEDAAESYYLNTYISKSVPTLEQNAAKAQSMSAELELKKKIIEEQVAQQGGLIQGSDQESALELINALYENKGAAEQYHNNVLNEIKTAPNLKDLKALRSRADMIVANTMLQGALNSAAYEYAMGTAKSTMVADPYALESFKTGQDIYKHRANAMFDHQVWKEQKAFEKMEGIGDYAPSKTGKGALDINTLLRRQGLDPSKMTPEAYQKKVDELTQGEKSKAFVTQGGASPYTGYEENRNNFIAFGDELHKQRFDNLANSIEIMRSKFQKQVRMNLPDSGAKAKQIQKELDFILEGTGISSNEILNGTKNITTALSAKTPSDVASSFGKLSVKMNDVASLWGQDVKAQTDVNKVIQEQASFSLIGNSIKQQMNSALAQAKESAGGNKRVEQMYDAMLGKGGFFISQQKAASDWAKKKLKEDVDAFEKTIMNGATPKEDINEQTLFTKYEREFNSKYKELRGNLESKITAFESPYFQPNKGGAQAAMYATSWDVNTSNPSIKDIPGYNVAQAIQKGSGKVFEGNIPVNIKDKPELTQQIKSYLQQATSAKGDKNLGFTVDAEIVSDMKYYNDRTAVTSNPAINKILDLSTAGVGSLASNLSDKTGTVAAGVVYKITPSPEGLKEQLGKEYDPSKDYSLSVYFDKNDDPNQLHTKARPSITDYAMRIKGNSVTTPLNSGNLTLTNMGDYYAVDGYFNYVNPYTRTMDKKNISDRYAISVAPSDAIQEQTQTVNDVINQLNATVYGRK